MLLIKIFGAIHDFGRNKQLGTILAEWSLSPGRQEAVLAEDQAGWRTRVVSFP